MWHLVTYVPSTERLNRHLDQSNEGMAVTLDARTPLAAET